MIGLTMRKILHSTPEAHHYDRNGKILKTDRETDGRTELRWLRRAVAVSAVER